MRRKLLKIGTEGVLAASSFWKNVCIGLSFGGRKITAVCRPVIRFITALSMRNTPLLSNARRLRTRVA
jgi:hypothetical protein